MSSSIDTSSGRASTRGLEINDDLSEKPYLDTSSETSSNRTRREDVIVIHELDKKLYADTSSEMASIRARREGIIDNLNEKLYVAVSKEFKACKSTLLWALQNSAGKGVCLIHVHQPSKTISVMGGKFPVGSLSGQEVRAHREKERQDMSKILSEYLQICAKAGVQAEKLDIEMDTIENGVVELIKRHKIERLVMGAATDNRYSKKMMEPKSKKANYVRQHAPAFCHIWFVCKGHLICTRESTKEYEESESSSGWHTPNSWTDSIESFDDYDLSSRFSVSRLSGYAGSSEVAAIDSTCTSFSRIEERESSSWSLAFPSRFEEKEDHSPSANMVVRRRVIKLDQELEGSMTDGEYDQLDQAMEEAEIAKREAFHESMKRQKAEKEALEAIRKARAAESFYLEESRRRKEIEKELGKAREELESTKLQRDMALEELQVVLEDKLLLETRVERSNVIGKELEDKMFSALALLQTYKKP